MNEALRPAGDVLERDYPLTGVTVSQPARGLEGRATGALEADQGRFIYKLHLAIGNRGWEGAAATLDFLREQGFEHAPTLLRTRQGAMTSQVGDRVMIVMERIEGETPRPSPTTYRQLGEIAGKLNRLTDYPHDCPVTLAGARREFPALAERLRDPADREEYLSLAAGLPDLDGLPRGLIHFDLTLGNTIQRPDGVIVALDWDEAGTGPRVFDASKPLISSFVSETDLVFAVEEARAYYEGYASQIRLTETEREALVDAALFHALRYIVWGDPEARWQRIKWAAAHRQELAAAVT